MKTGSALFARCGMSCGRRIEASTLAAAAERGSEHLSRLAEEGRGPVIHFRAEVRVVENVEEISPGLNRKPLVEPELAARNQSNSSLVLAYKIGAAVLFGIWRLSHKQLLNWGIAWRSR